LKNLNDHKKFIAEFVKSINSEKLETVDFDKLNIVLKDVNASLDEFHNLKFEHQIIKEDLIKRISGMAKAIAAVSKRHDEPKEFLEFINSLENISSENLLLAYRKVQAKFQDSFPSSFGLLNNRYNNSNCGKINEYK
jgi:hypothetical protein